VTGTKKRRRNLLKADQNSIDVHKTEAAPSPRDVGSPRRDEALCWPPPATTVYVSIATSVLLGSEGPRSNLRRRYIILRCGTCSPDVGDLSQGIAVRSDNT
jgi:hypothetical protein